MKIATANVAAMTDGGGIALTVRRDLRSPGRWAVHGADARRIGTVCPVGGLTADWWAVDRDDVVQGRATFGAALGMVVDAAIDVDTRGGPAPDGHPWAVHGPPWGVEPVAAVDLELRVAVLKRENAALKHANRDLTSAVEDARAAARSARTVLRTAARGDPEAVPGDRPLPFDRPAKSPPARLMIAAAKARAWRYNRRALREELRNRAAAVGVPFAVYVTGVLWRAVRRQESALVSDSDDRPADTPQSSGLP